MNAQISLKDMFFAKVKRSKHHAVPFIAILALIMACYWASANLEKGWATYVLSTVALTFVAITVLARLDDINPEHTSFKWQIRRAALVMVGASAVAVIAEPFFAMNVGRPIDFPSWREVVLRFGVAGMLGTTPHMPAWWSYITGRYRTTEEARKAAAAVDIRGILDTKEHPILSQDAVEAVMLTEKLAESGAVSHYREGTMPERRTGIERRKDWCPGCEHCAQDYFTPFDRRRTLR